MAIGSAKRTFDCASSELAEKIPYIIALLRLFARDDQVEPFAKVFVKWHARARKVEKSIRPFYDDLMRLYDVNQQPTFFGACAGSFHQRCVQLWFEFEGVLRQDVLRQAAGWPPCPPLTDKTIRSNWLRIKAPASNFHNDCLDQEAILFDATKVKRERLEMQSLNGRKNKAAEKNNGARGPTSQTKKLLQLLDENGCDYDAAVSADTATSVAAARQAVSRAREKYPHLIPNILKRDTT